MNKWFEKTNLASYAKTALLQAQKKIDQVLDIKEDEILLGLKTQEQQQIYKIETQNNYHNENKNLNHSNSNLTSKNNGEPDDFFSSFLGDKTDQIYEEKKNDNIGNELSVSSERRSSVTTEFLNVDSKHDFLINGNEFKNNKLINKDKQDWIQTYLEENEKQNNNIEYDSKRDTLNDELNINFTENTENNCNYNNNNNNKINNIDTNYHDNHNDEYFSNSSNHVDIKNDIKLDENDEKKLDDNTNKKDDNDFIKIDNLSGNASSNSDEPETCASSDIEVLSLPSNNDLIINSNNKKISNLRSNVVIVKSPPPPNSTGQQTCSSQLSPAILQQLKSSTTLKDLDVSSTSSTNTVTSLVSSSSQLTTPLENSDNNNNNNNSNNNNSNLRLILETREVQIIKLNKQNVELQEKNDNLLNEIERVKFELNQMKNDESNKNLQLEKDNLKKITEQLQLDLQEKLILIKEKDEQIGQLVQEGNKLSKQELNQSNIIKKLRAKEKENEEALIALKNETKKQQKEIEEIKNILIQKEEVEKQNFDTIKKLEKISLTYEKELESAKTTIEDSEEKMIGLKNALDNSYKELAELHKANAANQSKIMETQTSIEFQMKEEIQNALEKEKSMSKKKEDALRWELQGVRADMTRLEQQNALREDILRKEITDLQKQLRDSEVRNNELSQSISSATRPLIRQIENLQLTHASQIQMLENAEKNLIERLKGTQLQLCDFNEKDRHNNELLNDAMQKVKTFEIQIQTLKIDKSRLIAELETLKEKYDQYENEKLHKDAQNEVIVNSLNRQIENLSKEKRLLESQLEIEKEKTEADAKKLQNLILEYSKEKETEQQNKQLTINLSANNSPFKSTAKQNELLISNDESPNLINKQTSVYDFLRNSTTINTLESLQSKLKEKEGEIIQLQKNINDLERIRESLAKELVNLSTKIESLENQTKVYPILEENFNKLNAEYAALLQMYGEKDEECEELKMDLQDVKDMYKLQIEDLIKRTST